MGEYLNITGFAHVAFFDKGLVHAESILQGERDVARAVFRQLEIVPKQLLIVGVGTVLDDAGSTLAGRFAAQVGHTLLGDQNAHIVLGAVHMRHIGHDGRDQAVLGRGRSGEDRQVGVAGEVGRTADAVHDLAAHHMGAVDIAEEVGLECRVDGDDPQTADHFRMVGDFLRAQQYAVAEHVEVVVHQVEMVLGKGERAAGGKTDAPLEHQVDNGVLDHLGEHGEGGQIGVGTQGTEHGIGNVAHTGLQRQELARDAAFLPFLKQEGGHILTDAARSVVQRREGGDVVALVGIDHTGYFRRVDIQIGAACAVVHMEDRNVLAVGRSLERIQVVHAFQTVAVALVQLYDNLFGRAHDSRGDSYGGAQDDASLGRDGRSLDNGGVDASQESVVHVLADMRQVEVIVFHLAGVDGAAHVGVGLERGAEAHGAGLGQGTVYLTAGGTAGNQTDLKGHFIAVGFRGIGSQRCRNGFGRTDGRETADGHSVAMMNQADGFFGCEYRISHFCSF